MADKYTVVEETDGVKKKGSNDCHVDTASFDGDISSLDTCSEAVDTSCGLGPCRPHWLQRCNNPQVLCVCLCVYTLIHGE